MPPYNEWHMHLSEVLFFSVFLVVIIGILVIDLGVFNKKSHVISFREAMGWTILWIALAIGFYFFMRLHGDWLHGIQTKEQLMQISQKYQHDIKLQGLTFEEAIIIYRHNLGLEYITGYLIEKALSIDNIFVMIMIFMAFGIEQKHYHRVLFWGILGAIVMRFIFIFVSSALIQQFFWILYVFGGLLIFTGLRMFVNRNKEETIDTEKHPIVQFASRHFRVDPTYKGRKFMIKKEGKRYVTPLFLVLLVIEFTDVIFAVDSVPAIFAVSKDPYIVFFSNIFAIIGLRALFFVLMNVINYFHYLKIGLSVLLVVIGVKMLIHDWLKEIGFETIHSLYIIVFILGSSMLASVLFPKRKKVEEV